MKSQITKIVQNFRHALGGVAAGAAPVAARCGSVLRHRGVGLIVLGAVGDSGNAITGICLKPLTLGENCK